MIEGIYIVTCRKEETEVATLPSYKFCSRSYFMWPFRFCLHTFVVIVGLKVFIFLRGTVWQSLFFIMPGIFSEWVLWIGHWMPIISRFTSLAELKRWDLDQTGSTLHSVDIAENLRVVYKAKKCRQWATPSFYLNILEFAIKWNNLLLNSLWSFPPSHNKSPLKGLLVGKLTSRDAETLIRFKDDRWI